MTGKEVKRKIGKRQDSGHGGHQGGSCRARGWGGCGGDIEQMEQRS